MVQITPNCRHNNRGYFTQLYNWREEFVDPDTAVPQLLHDRTATEIACPNLEGGHPASLCACALADVQGTSNRMALPSNKPDRYEFDEIFLSFFKKIPMQPGYEIEVFTYSLGSIPTDSSLTPASLVC